MAASGSSLTYLDMLDAKLDSTCFTTRLRKEWLRGMRKKDDTFQSWFDSKTNIRMVLVEMHTARPHGALDNHKQFRAFSQHLQSHCICHRLHLFTTRTRIYNIQGTKHYWLSRHMPFEIFPSKASSSNLDPLSNKRWQKTSMLGGKPILTVILEGKQRWHPSNIFQYIQ